MYASRQKQADTDINGPENLLLAYILLGLRSDSGESFVCKDNKGHKIIPRYLCLTGPSIELVTM